MADDAKNEEAAMRHLIEAWTSAVLARDISGIIVHHTDDVLMFDVPPPGRSAESQPMGDVASILRRAGRRRSCI